MWDLMRYADKTAFINEYGQSVTYRELNIFAAEIGDIIGNRCVAFVLCDNSIASVAGYVAFLTKRIVPLLLSVRIDSGLLESLLSAYTPEYLWIPYARRDDFVGLEYVYEAYGYVLLKKDYGKATELYSELALLLTTSGSTGSPKLVRQSYANIMSNAEAIAEYLELDETQKPITTLPMHYTYGLSIINSHLLVGASVILNNYSVMQKEFWQLLKSQKATSFGGVPYTYEMLDKLGFFRMDLPDLQYMTQAGGKLSPELHRKYAKYAEEAGKKFFVMYGQCEATARMSYLPAEQSLRKYGSVGIAIPGGKFTLVDADGGTVIEPDTVGELVYEGVNVTLGYAESADDLKLGDLRHGRLETGDMAKRDEEGFYYIVGRKKRFLKVYGNRVNLDEMEMLIKDKYEGIECVVSGIDDQVYIFLLDDSIADEIKTFIARKTRLNPVAFKTVLLEAIPKNDAGKIKYSELEKYYGKTL